VRPRPPVAAKVTADWRSEDPHKVLGVAKNASRAAIRKVRTDFYVMLCYAYSSHTLKQAWRTLVLKYHPDKCNSPPDAFIAVSKAYHSLD